jgi:hypothetical protein
MSENVLPNRSRADSRIDGRISDSAPKNQQYGDDLHAEHGKAEESRHRNGLDQSSDTDTQGEDCSDMRRR